MFHSSAYIWAPSEHNKAILHDVFTIAVDFIYIPRPCVNKSSRCKTTVITFYFFSGLWLWKGIDGLPNTKPFHHGSGNCIHETMQDSIPAHSWPFDELIFIVLSATLLSTAPFIFKALRI